MLGHRTIFERRARHVHDALESARLSDMEEQYVKLNSQSPSGVTDTSRGRLASFQDVCHEHYVSKADQDLGTFEDDHHFKNEAARRVFKKILKWGCSTSAEPSLLAVIRFDAITTDTVDSFSFCSQNVRSPDGSFLQCETFHAEVGERLNINSNKEKTIPQDSLRRRKQLLPVAASNRFTSCLQTFRENCRKDSKSFCSESSATYFGSCDEMMKNAKREHSVSFKMSDNERYCIGLVAHLFKDYICDRRADLYDCFILFSRSLNEPFKPIQSLSPLDVIQKCDGELGTFDNDQPATGFHDDIGHSSFNDVRMLKLDDSEGSEWKL